MYFWKQEFLHRPDDEPPTVGDCQRAVLACLLELSLEDVPHFGELAWQDADRHRKLVQDWLLHQGYIEVSIPFSGDHTAEEVMAFFGKMNPDTYYMLSGLSANDVCHVVICCNDSLVWDTSKDASGIVAPVPDENIDQSFYWVSVLVPTTIHLNELAEDIPDAIL